MLHKGNKKVINGWAMYDWANSVYSLVITSTIFPIYYTKVTSTASTVKFLGREFINTSLYTYSLSFAFLLIACVSPILSSLADYSGNKKGFMRFFCYQGSMACCGLFFFTGENLGWGLFCFVLASIGFSGSLVFYNAYLPEIADEKDQDRVSAKGFALGYIGSSLLLILNLWMVMKPEFFGLAPGTIASRISFLMTGLWWVGFSQITFYYLPKNPFEDRYVHTLRSEKIFLVKGYRELQAVWKQLNQLVQLRWFLLSFFFYTMGVQTVMYVATLFGEKELHLDTSVLITTILIIQFVAIAGAYFFSYLSSRIGNIRSLMLSVTIWIGICVGAFFVYTEKDFYIIAFCVGLVMGGIQSLSRSTYSKMLPETRDHASFFSFYDIMEKSGIVLGTASYGLIEELTGSMRNSLVALIFYFVIGLGLLTMLYFRKK